MLEGTDRPKLCGDREGHCALGCYGPAPPWPPSTLGGQTAQVPKSELSPGPRRRQNQAHAKAFTDVCYVSTADAGGVQNSSHGVFREEGFVTDVVWSWFIQFYSSLIHPYPCTSGSLRPHPLLGATGASGAGLGVSVAHTPDM